MFPDDFFYRLVAALLVIGVLVGLLLAYGVPWAWALVKPLLHALTA